MLQVPALSDDRVTRIAHRVVVHERVGSLEEAASLRCVDPAAVIKTIVVRRGEGDYLFVLVPGDRVIDWSKLRSLLGERRLSMPDADEALEATGYARGTITPFAAKSVLPVVADIRIASGQVSIGAGAPGASLTVDGADLAEVVGATVADVTKERSG
jgi:Cys-tRNA(Pro) deacylase